MLRVSAIMFIIRQNVYKNAQRKLNNGGERHFSLTSVIILAYVVL